MMFFLLLLVTNASLLLLYPFSRSRLLLVAAIYGAVTLLTLYLLFHPRNQWLVANRSRVNGAGCLALTFDDGPDPVDTPKLLDLLREKNVKATFFVVGKRADQHPEIVRRAWAEGHPVANHTWSHYSLFCLLQQLQDFRCVGISPNRSESSRSYRPEADKMKALRFPKRARPCGLLKVPAASPFTCQAGQ
jgi:hypothetical protein